MAAARAFFYEEQAAGEGEKIIYRVRALWDGNIYVKRTGLSEEDLIRRGAEKLAQPELGGRKIGLFYWDYDTSIDTLGGYVEQAFYPDTYRLLRSMSGGEKESAEQECEYYMAFGKLEDPEGWYPLDRFIWEDDPQPREAGELRKIIIAPL